MITPRRFLPSINSLLALEAVERLGTATAAADELSLTHSAVSRQLKVLEEQIGVSLLRREGKGLGLTPAGATYAHSIRDILHDLARASLWVKAGGAKETLTLAVTPSFGTHWLIPRLSKLHQQHPEVLVNLNTRMGPIDFNREKFDAAVHYGNQDWPGVEYLRLCGGRVIPCAAPGLLPKSIRSPDELLSAPLLHLESRPGAWEEWFAQHGCQAIGLRGMLFDQFTAMAEAVAMGFGMALLPDFVAEPMFRTGRIVPAAEDYLEEEGDYFLVYPEGQPHSPQFDLLIEYLEGARA